MDFSTLKQLSKVYPILVKPFDLFDATTVTDQDIQTKIDSVIQYMNSLGQSNNDTVRSWNKVMQWVMDEGLTDSVNAKIDDMMANGTFNDLLTTLTNSLLGSEVLTTTNQDVKGAINEVKGIADSNTSALANKANQSDLTTTNNNLALKADKTYVDTKTASLASGSPKGTYATLTDLQTAFPSGNTNIYVVTADGKWYYWNGSAWSAGAVYQSTSLGAGSVTWDKTNFIGINNLLIKANATLGQFMNSSGVLSANANYNVSDYIAVTPSTSYIASYHRLTAFYDANKNFLSVFDSTTSIYSDTSINVPAGAYYLRTDIALANSAYDNYYIYPTNAKYDLTTLTGSKTVKDSVTQNVNANYFTKYNFNTGNNPLTGMFLNNDGTTTVNASYNTTDFIAVQSGATYTASMHRRTVFYNTSKAVIGYFDSGSPIYADTDITTPNGCAYLKTTIPTANYVGYYLYAKSYRSLLIGNGDIKPMNLDLPQSGYSSKWLGKTFVSLGDSITAQDGATYNNASYPANTGQIAVGYQTVIKNALGFGSYSNQGVSGRPMASGTSAGLGTYDTGSALTYTSYDLVIIAAATNDFKLNVPIGIKGQIGDTTFDTTTFYGAYRKLIEYILTNKPSIRIVLFTPLQRDNSGYDVNYTNSAGAKLIDYVNAIQSIGEMYGLPVCDLYRNSGITKLTLSTFLMDGLHPHDGGYSRMGGYASKYIDNIGL